MITYVFDWITYICFACHYTFKRAMQFLTHSIQNQVIYTNLTINCLSLSHDRLLQSLCLSWYVTCFALLLLYTYPLIIHCTYIYIYDKNVARICIKIQWMVNIALIDLTNLLNQYIDWSIGKFKILKRNIFFSSLNYNVYDKIKYGLYLFTFFLKNWKLPIWSNHLILKCLNKCVILFTIENIM